MYGYKIIIRAIFVQDGKYSPQLFLDYVLYKYVRVWKNLFDGCYNMMQKCCKPKNIAIGHVKKSVYRICFLYMSKHEAKKLMTTSNLIDKKDVL